MPTPLESDRQSPIQGSNRDRQMGSADNPSVAISAIIPSSPEPTNRLPEAD